jgi:hypothetical protein
MGVLIAPAFRVLGRADLLQAACGVLGEEPVSVDHIVQRQSRRGLGRPVRSGRIQEAGQPDQVTDRQRSGGGSQQAEHVDGEAPGTANQPGDLLAG